LDLQPTERGRQGRILESDLVLWIVFSAVELQLATRGELKTEKANEAAATVNRLLQYYF
jgi:hypothetical protein